MATRLREITMENHKKAERSQFIGRIIKKTLTPHQYYLYLANMLPMYSVLEEAAGKTDIFKGIGSIKRVNHLKSDVEELEKIHKFRKPFIANATYEYCDYIMNHISTDREKLLAHVYVRHMGDLSGGQIIKKMIHGSGKHYTFSGDVVELKKKLGDKLSDDLADEANKCFELVTGFLQELDCHIALHEVEPKIEGTLDDMGKTQ